MISIVMGYVNRLSQTKKTLQSIQKSHTKKIEIIIVDDFSDFDQQATLLLKDFPYLNLKIINLRDYFVEKKHCNPCLAYNIGFNFVTGDKIIIQNPECMHFGDVVSYVEQHLNNNNYLTFNCYSLDQKDTEHFFKTEEIIFNNMIAGYPGSCWYNHHQLRPVGYHFTSAITKDNLIELGGFDEIFANGIGFDDDEFLQRIKHKNLKIEFISEPMVVHLYHENSFGNNITSEKIEKNRKLLLQTIDYNKTKTKSNFFTNKWNFYKISKVAHFYWGGAPLSYFRYLSVASFSKLNKDWKIKVHTSHGQNIITWDSGEQFKKYEGLDHFNFLKKLKNVEIVHHDFTNTLVEHAHHVHRSDFLRWKVLYEEGGLWSDSDILYVNPINNLIENTNDNQDLDATICPYVKGINKNKNTIGFILSAKNNIFIKNIFDLTHREFNINEYQSIGSEIINNYFYDVNHINFIFQNTKVKQLNYKCVYVLDVDDFNLLYQDVNDRTLSLLYNPNIIGFHWFGGNKTSSDFENNFHDAKIFKYNNFLRHAFNKIFTYEDN